MGDHCKYVSEYMRNGIKIYSSDAVEKDVQEIYGEIIHGVPTNKPFKVGGFKVIPFDLHHGCSCVGFHISHTEIGMMLFITDTSYSEYKFKNINHILIEANYCDELLNQNERSGHKKHILYGHMNIETTKRFVKSNNSKNLKNVVLLHLSDGHSDEKLFQKEIEEVTDANVYVADKGKVIDL